MFIEAPTCVYDDLSDGLGRWDDAVQLDTQRLVEGIGVELRWQGKDLVGRCPFHEVLAGPAGLLAVAAGVSDRFLCPSAASRTSLSRLGPTQLHRTRSAPRVRRTSAMTMPPVWTPLAARPSIATTEMPGWRPGAHGPPTERRRGKDGIRLSRTWIRFE